LSAKLTQIADELIVFRSFWHKLTNGIEVDEKPHLIEIAALKRATIQDCESAVTKLTDS